MQNNEVFNIQELKAVEPCTRLKRVLDPSICSVSMLPYNNQPNTHITDMVGGRAFEVTHEDRKIVWEYINPKRAGENNELIAALFEVICLEKDFSLTWVNKSNAVVDISLDKAVVGH